MYLSILSLYCYTIYMAWLLEIDMFTQFLGSVHRKSKNPFLEIFKIVINVRITNQILKYKVILIRE